MLRVAQVGCGAVGALHAAGIIRSGGARLVATCDASPERAASLAERYQARSYSDLRTLLETHGPDAVLVATPDPFHGEIVLAALAAGCHVFCEKPLATTVPEARAMVAAARVAGRELGVDYNRRFGWGYQTARGLVDSGRIGRLWRAVIEVIDGPPALAIREHSLVMLTTLLTHHIDLARWFLGEVQAVHLVTGARRTGDLVADLVLTLSFASGAIAVIAAAYREGQTRTWERAQLAGQTGSITIDDVTGPVEWMGTDPDRRETIRPPADDLAAATGASELFATIPRHVAAFLDAIAHGRPCPVAGAEGLAGLAVADAALQSQRAGKMVPIEPLGKEP